MIGNKDFSEINFRMDFVSVTIVNIRRSPLVIGLGLITETHIRRDKLRLHRIIRQGSSARDFVPVQSFKNGGILYVFPVF